MSKSNPLKIFSLNRVIIPLIIGIGVALFLIIKDFSKPLITEVALGKGNFYWVDDNGNKAKEISELYPATKDIQGNINIEHQKNILKHIANNWTWSASLCLLVAMLFALLRGFMYMWRIRYLSDNKLSWKQSFQIIALWEFSSAITPTVIGGSAVAFFTVSMEGIGIARSTAIVMITFLMDELFYIIIAPITILIVGVNSAMIKDLDFKVLSYDFTLLGVFLIGYAVMCLITIFVLIAIFLSPKSFKKFLYYLSEKKIFTKRKEKLRKLGDDIITTSLEFKHKPFFFWIKTYLITISSWISRFLVVNFLIMAFTSVSNNLLVFARQLVMWIVLCVSPTPGGSGIAEFAFPIFLKEFIPLNMGAILSVLWRIFTYYPYIIIGFIVLPLWIKRIVKTKSSTDL
ncbi:MAG: flippase-like domain-containing protein [Bacteroidales bacterium]|jgi:uncharacterized protein (TIRG00374 family)|nr:flippase-like domain-containing protein [Bacteroidales bacterium]